jgi:glycosyltransferase involved in cell wall biosynthesis
MDIEESVEFLGYLKNPKFVMKQCDLLLMCSRNEAFGLVTLEAMQAGIPVIGTRSGGTVELVTDNVNGFLYTPGNYEELAEKLEFLYDNHDRVKEMGNFSKQIAEERFSYSRYILETLKVLTQLVSGKQ